MNRPAYLVCADVVAERIRQIAAEGYALEQDDQTDGRLAVGAAAYALAAAGWRSAPMVWPFPLAGFKPTGARSSLVKAAALLVAEIERLDRGGAPAATVGASTGPDFDRLDEVRCGAKPACGQALGRGHTCMTPRAAGERLCPDCNPNGPHGTKLYAGSPPAAGEPALRGFEPMPALLEEAASMIRGMTLAEFDRLEVRHFLCDELEGSAIMLRDALAQQQAAR